MAKTPSFPARSSYPLKPREFVPAWLPMIPMLRGAFKGSMLLLFFRRTVEAAPMVRMRLVCLFASYTGRTFTKRLTLYDFLEH